MILSHPFCRGSLAAGLLLLAPAVVLASPARPQVPGAAPAQFVPTAQPALLAQSFKPPQTSGATSTAGGATRGAGQCDRIAAPVRVVPLMPTVKTAQSEAELFSMTLSDRPTLYWYVEPQAQPVSASFLLVKGSEVYGKQRQIVHEATVELPEAAGIVALPWSEAVAPLEAEAQYQWYLSFSCDPDAAEPEVQLSGWLMRRSPQELLSSARVEALETAQAEADLLAQAAIFAESGIWQDALMAMVQLRQDQMADGAAALDAVGQEHLTQEWQSFLASVGLEAIAESPIVDEPALEATRLMLVQ